MATKDLIKANLIALGFTNPSASALYNKIADAISPVIDTTLNELSNTQQSILNIISNQRYGKAGYYTSKALAFQFGYSLSQDPITLDYIYAVIDATAQIITQAAFVNITSGNSAQLFLKVATTDTQGNTVALTSTQLAAFNNYFVNFQIPGLPVTVISNSANILYFNAAASYYSTYDLPTLQANLTTALSNYKKTFTSNNFNGVFFAGDLQDYVKANVPGIRDFYINNTLIDSVAFAGSTPLNSGYFNYVLNILNNIIYVPV
jgi:hypothetical protein